MSVGDMHRTVSEGDVPGHADPRGGKARHLQGARGRLFDPASTTSLSGRARSRRWTEFLRVFPDLREMRVLDLGGTPAYWTSAEVRPASVRCVNLDPQHSSVAPWLEYAVGDACQPQKGQFDLVVSNSLIEHVGGLERRLRFSETVRSAAERHWVQTPYRYFPVEPHWVFPGFQFLPIAARMKVSARWPLGHIRSAGDGAWTDVAWVELLSITEMRHQFPDSTIWYERWGGAIKSLVAVKR